MELGLQHVTVMGWKQAPRFFFFLFKGALKNKVYDWGIVPPVETQFSHFSMVFFWSQSFMDGIRIL